MADDRLDDAIDAVVRAVDRIERATRVPAPAPPPAAPPIAPPAAPAFGDATVPTQGSVGATGGFWAPRTDAPGADAPLVDASEAEGIPAASPRIDARWPARPETTAEFSALGAETVRPYADEGASPELHELVGRIVGRMQSLDDHLAAASQLRSEISELVARLAAAASKPG